MKLLSCQELIDYLTLYVEGSLPADEHSRMDEHLAVCPESVDYLKNFRSTLELTQTACQTDASDVPPLPEALVQAILAARNAR
jgi:anti-sigma factor RsiW